MVAHEAAVVVGRSAHAIEADTDVSLASACRAAAGVDGWAS